MNLTELFQIQKKLDERIIKEHGLEGQDLLDKKILALQVEIGELANEWRGFKFWSKDQEPRSKEPLTARGKYYYNPLLEEYVDCLHFILSIGAELESDHARWFKEDKPFDFNYSNITVQFNRLFDAVVRVSDSDNFECEEYEELFYTFIALGKQLGFTWEQTETAYLNKNRINHTRQDNSY